MPGSGKSIVVETAKELGYDIVTMGDVVREQTRLQGLNQLQQTSAKSCWSSVHKKANMSSPKNASPKSRSKKATASSSTVLRSLFEADIFKEHFASFTLVAVHAPPNVRFERLKVSGRSDDPPNYEVFHERDMREMGVGLGNVIAMAEKILVNDNSIEGFKALVKENFSRIEEKWLK